MPVDRHDLLTDFEARLVAWRTRQNEATARARELVADDRDPPDPKQWAATIIAAGQVYLRRGEHLRPAGAGHADRGRVLSCDRQRPFGCGEGWSDVAAFAACAVGLFEDAMSRIVVSWMRHHSVESSTLPWRIACRVAGELVPEPEDARWRLRTGDGKVYDALPWREAARMAEADGALARVSLAEAETLAACRARLGSTS